MVALQIQPGEVMPEDADRACLLARVWRPGSNAGPSPAVLNAGEVRDLSAIEPTLADLLARPDVVEVARSGAGEPIGPAADILANSAADGQDPGRPYLLAPADLQAIKACGVTFVRSMLERVIEEQAKGDPELARAIRADIGAEIGERLADIVPGSEDALAVKQVLVERDLWSQYLEVGIGPDAEVFTKCQPMASVGLGAEIGIHPQSVWNNPEPEVVMVVTAAGETVGVTLGNDVNLRDFEGRSALLLGKAKDNRGSCAIGPFIRLFDDNFTMADVRRLQIGLRVDGDDGFALDAVSSIGEISRDPADLVAQACGRHNHYPDGLLLFTGTMFAPTEDRDREGEGFTHHLGDLVRISAPQLGTLVNRVNHTDRLPRWDFGLGALMGNLAARGLLRT